MALANRLRERGSAISERWLRAALATYADDAAAAFGRQEDPFANPVGHALRTGICAALNAVLEGKQPEDICSCLDPIIKIRAVQQFNPSRAVSFVFSLKEAIRAELRADDAQDPAISAELAELERRIDRVALGTFDVYVRYREQVYELRVNEIKRSVGKLVERMNRRSCLSEPGEDLLRPAAPARADAERGDGQ